MRDSIFGVSGSLKRDETLPLCDCVRFIRLVPGGGGGSVACLQLQLGGQTVQCSAHVTGEKHTCSRSGGGIRQRARSDFMRFFPCLRFQRTRPSSCAWAFRPCWNSK